MLLLTRDAVGASLDEVIGRMAPRLDDKKILDHRALGAIVPTYSLAQVGQARACALAGDTARSRYQDFLALWKDADPDIPILKQAKAEYAKLQ